ncbi:MAG TPA: DinB family protein [Methylomirabilota bacterium]|nr:DinB family protein [Methylomirabilota bacterium]
MASPIVAALRKKADAAWANLSRQLEGMEPYMERSNAPGQWTTRQVLCHLLFEPGWGPVATLKTFSATDPPVIDVAPGQTKVTSERQKMTLKQFKEALDTQRRETFAYLDALGEDDLQRKSRIPVFKEIMGNDEVSLPVFVGVFFDYHWNDHAGQLAKIRKAVGLPEAKSRCARSLGRCSRPRPCSRSRSGFSPASARSRRCARISPTPASPALAPTPMCWSAR